MPESHAETYRLLHGKECQDLEQVVLDDISNDPILVKIAAPTFSAKILAEDHLQLHSLCYSQSPREQKMCMVHVLEFGLFAEKVHTLRMWDCLDPWH